MEDEAEGKDNPVSVPTTGGAEPKGNEGLASDMDNNTAKPDAIKEENGEQVLLTSPLFNWFRGDFRSYDGVDDFLVAYGVLQEEQKNMDRKYENYDWTLETGIWAEEE